MFKDNINLDYFLKLPKSMYEHFARFRTGNHRFSCETGSYQGVDHAERKCGLCNMQDVGDEIHYLLICPCFQNGREKYIKKYLYTTPNILKFRQLMSADKLRVSVLKPLCLFIRTLLHKVK